MLNIFLEALRDTVLITGLVMVMMLLIEYININSRGSAFKKLRSSSLKQVLVGTLLGLIPGCIGGFAAVSLYTHRMLSFGALIAMMIASTGDESFIMLAIIPKTAIILFVALFFIALIAGLIVDRFSKKEIAPFEPDTHFKLHDHCCGVHDHTEEHRHSECECEPAHSHENTPEEGGIFGKSIRSNLKNISRERLLIMVGISLFIIAVVFGILEHSHEAHGDHSHASHSHEIVITDTEAHTHSDTHIHSHGTTHSNSSTGHDTIHNHGSGTHDHSNEAHNHSNGTAHGNSSAGHDATHSHDSATTHDHSSAGHDTIHNHSSSTHDHSNEAHSHDNIHDHSDHMHFDIFSERWLNLLFALVSLITLILTARATEHFIKEHLWNHVIKKHLLKIFLWTLGALIAIHFGLQYLDIGGWMSKNVYLVILMAAIIGLIPESGPHMIFIAFFANGMVPFSVLLTSCIVQDGHTTLPLLAESKMSFAKAKLVNLLIGLTVGIIAQLISTFI